METPVQVQCPVCCKPFKGSEINEHIDECLSDQTVSRDQDVIFEKSENQVTNRKRKSDSPNSSGWGFLKAASSEPVPHTAKKNRIQLNKQADLTVTHASNIVDSSKSCSNKISGEKQNYQKIAESAQNNATLSLKPDPSISNENFGSEITDESVETNIDPFKPLAEQMRPTSFEDYIGHDKEVGDKTMLGALLQSDNVPSMVLWGPPGCGKTTLARVIAHKCKSGGRSKFVQLSAAAAGVNDVKEVIKIAKNDMKMFRKKTVLFLDEIHRFNKTQQDTLLPHVEDGSITLIGATTENPSFQVNSALLSRCRVIVLDKLSSEAVQQILRRAVTRLKAKVLEDENKKTMDTKEASSSDICTKVQEAVVFTLMWASQFKVLHPSLICDWQGNVRNSVWVEKEALETLSHLCDGDARVALNGLQMAIQSQSSKFNQSRNSLHPGLQPGTENRSCAFNSQKFKSERTVGSVHNKINGSDKRKKEEINAVIVRTEHIKEGLQKSHILYDRAGEEHYNIISALHKSMRGSDDSAALYWLARMLEGGETPLYVARRLVRFASEDIGLADPLALNQSVAAYQACHFIGMPECEVILAQCVVYLSRAPKSVEVYMAYNKAKKCVRSHQGPLPSVPLHLRNAPTKLMKDLGYSKGYKYNPSYSEPVDQEYFPECLKGINFFK